MACTCFFFILERGETHSEHIFSNNGPHFAICLFSFGNFLYILQVWVGSISIKTICDCNICIEC